MVMLGAQLQQRRSLKLRIDQLAEITANLSVAEQELSELRSKELLLHYSERHRASVKEPSWVGLIESLAPCLPANARLEEISLSDRKNLVLRGVMYSGDHTYELLMALKQLPAMREVSVESVSPMGDFGSNQLHFEIRCRLRQSFELSPSQTDPMERLVSKQR